MVQRILLALILIPSCYSSQQDQLEAWEVPFFELDTDSRRLPVPFEGNRSIQNKPRMFGIAPDNKSYEQYWNYKPKGDSRSKVWQKTFKRRLSSYSKRWVRYPFLPLRVSPSLQAKVTGRLEQGDLVWVQSIRNNWARLKSGAYVPLESLSPFPPTLGGIGEGFLMEEPLH